MELEVLLKALGEPKRLQIFRCLLERKHCVRSLSEKLGITESAVSQHLKVLKEAGLVYGKRYGYHIHYYPDQETLGFLVSAFENMSRQAAEPERDPAVCSCAFRRNSNGHTC